jgi:hypothetical protein
MLKSPPNVEAPSTEPSLRRRMIIDTARQLGLL